MTNNDIIVVKAPDIKQVCPICGQTYTLPAYTIQPACNKCIPVIFENFFKEEYNNYTIDEFKKAMKQILSSK